MLTPKLKKNILSALILLGLLTALISLIKGPIKNVFEYNVDEGFESIKSALFLKGFSLYKEIWCDQPPLYTVAQSCWFKLFGSSLYHGRILVSIFSCVFLWAFYQTIKNLWGKFCGFLAVIFLLLSALYLRLGISIMHGTVALSLAMLSIYFITLYKKSYAKYHLALSGIFFALSLQTKLITAFLVPLIILEIIQINWIGLSERRKLSLLFRPLILWLSSLLAVSLIFIAVFFHFNLPLIIQLLIQPHLTKITAPGSNFFTIWQIILTDYDIALLALMGIILLVRQKKWRFIFPALWLSATLAAIAVYRPIWEHYYTLVSIPICWLAAISFSRFFSKIRNMKTTEIKKPKRTDIFFRWLTAAIIILTILKIPGKYDRMLKSIQVETTPEENKIVNFLLKHKKNIRWIFTDRPTFAFKADILVPPELAIATEKRDLASKSGQIYLINKLEEYRPEVIVFQSSAMLTIGPPAISYIKENYILFYELTPHGKEEILPLSIETELFIKLKSNFDQIKLFRPKPDYKYFYRLLTKELQDKAGYFLVETLKELIASAPQPITKESLNANPILPFTLSGNGRFRLKPYDQVSKKWEEKLQNQSVSFFAYQFFKAMLKTWESEHENGAIPTSTISRLKSLRERVLEDMKTNKVMSSFYPRDFKFTSTFYEKFFHNPIKLYLRKDAAELYND